VSYNNINNNNSNSHELGVKRCPLSQHIQYSQPNRKIFHLYIFTFIKGRCHETTRCMNFRIMCVSTVTWKSNRSLCTIFKWPVQQIYISMKTFKHICHFYGSLEIQTRAHFSDLFLVMPSLYRLHKADQNS
jgi:hypothetical protein